MKDNVFADVTALASLITSLIALVVALSTMRKSDDNMSGPILLSFNETFRLAWQRVLGAEEGKARNYELAELMNLFEIASAIYLQQSIHGRSGKLLEDYLLRSLDILLDEASLSGQVAGMIHDRSTFENISEFVSNHRKIENKVRLLLR